MSITFCRSVSACSVRVLRLFYDRAQAASIKPADASLHCACVAIMTACRYLLVTAVSRNCQRSLIMLSGVACPSQTSLHCMTQTSCPVVRANRRAWRTINSTVLLVFNTVTSASHEAGDDPPWTSRLDPVSLAKLTLCFVHRSFVCSRVETTGV